MHSLQLKKESTSSHLSQNHESLAKPSKSQRNSHNLNSVSNL